VKAAKIDDAVHAADLDAILVFLPRFHDADLSPAAIREPGIHEQDGELFIDRGENHPLVSEFISALYEHGFVRDFDWIAWQSDAECLHAKPELLQSASLCTCVKLLTLHARREHFVDGHFSSMVRTGHISRILHRIKRLKSQLTQG
jgi:hypothetical protein